MIFIFFMRVQEISRNQNIDASDFFSYTGQKQKKNYQCVCANFKRNHFWNLGSKVVIIILLAQRKL